MPRYHVVELQGLIPARWEFEAPTITDAVNIFRMGFCPARKHGAVPAIFVANETLKKGIVDCESNGIRDKRRLYQLPLTD